MQGLLIFAIFVSLCCLDDETWDIRFNFKGYDILERTLGESAVTYRKLLALIEIDGYGINDSMYYAKVVRAGMVGRWILFSPTRM